MWLQSSVWWPQVGNFIALNALKSGRFLDPPEFTVLHDKGNLENVFDRLDYTCRRRIRSI